MGAAVRRSSLFLLLVIEVLSLFVFENMRALFATLEAREREGITAMAELQADLYVLRLGRTPPPRSDGFASVERLAAGTDGRQVVAGEDGAPLLEVRRRLADGSGLRFRRPLRSPQLGSFLGMRKVLTLLIVILGLAIVLSGVYLAMQLRRRKAAPGAQARAAGTGSPLQDYLVEMKSAQQDLQELVAAQRRAAGAQEELNRGIVQNIHLGVIYVSAAGRVEIFNPAAQRLFGRSFAAAKNAPLETVLSGHPELARFILAAAGRNAAEIESGPFVFAVEVVPIGAEQDGAPADAAPAGEKLQGRLALVRDVGEERRRERVRRQGENLMMLGEMAASLAHEVRNSLGVVLGYSKAMSGEPEKTAKIVREVQFLTEMMEGFLRFARPVDKVARKPVALGPLVAAAGAAHELAVDLPASPLEVQGDPLLLNVVLGNLALNARQAGARRLGVRFAAGPPAAMVIADDGPGIPAANAEKVWLPFFSSRDKGTGMGLATVKKLLSALDADIQLMNPGKPGAQFKITFYN